MGGAEYVVVGVAKVAQEGEETVVPMVEIGEMVNGT